MKSHAREYVYWSGLNKNIDEIAKECNRCQLAAKLPTGEPPAPWPPTKSPWTLIHVDFVGPINGIWHLVAVDSHSKWPEIIPLKHASISATKISLERIFETHAIPLSLVTDNGTQLTLTQIEQFCKDGCIEHVSSPPYHPQSNGQGNPLSTR